MASVSRKVIDDALFELINKNLPTSVRTVSRKIKGWEDVPPSEQPAVFVVWRGDSVKRQRYLPAVTTTKYDVVVYVHSGGDSSVSPAEFLNPIVDSVCDSLEPDDYTGTQTLGLPDSVSHAFISGEIFADEGILGEQAFAVIPVEIMWL